MIALSRRSFADAAPPARSLARPFIFSGRIIVNLDRSKKPTTYPSSVVSLSFSLRERERERESEAWSRHADVASRELRPTGLSIR